MMKRNNILILVSAAALMSGCGIYGKYERPDVNVSGIVRDVNPVHKPNAETPIVVSTGILTDARVLQLLNA